jgi:hypothetical protein
MKIFHSTGVSGEKSANFKKFAAAERNPALEV